MSIYLRQSSSGSTRTRKRCASGVKRSSIPSARSRPEWAATHFLMKRLPRVATEMALHVLAYNLPRGMQMIGIKSLIAAIRA